MAGLTWFEYYSDAKALPGGCLDAGRAGQRSRTVHDEEENADARQRPGEPKGGQVPRHDAARAHRGVLRRTVACAREAGTGGPWMVRGDYRTASRRDGALLISAHRRREVLGRIG